MAQPYDLTGLNAAIVTVQGMVADQAAGRVKFAGGSETWLPDPAGTFTAIVSVGGSLVPTTTTAVRDMLAQLRSLFDLLTAAPGKLAENAITTTAAAVPGAALASGCKGASGPLVYIGTAQGTSYDLSGIAAALATATAMLADQQSGVTNFLVPFQALGVPSSLPPLTLALESGGDLLLEGGGASLQLENNAGFVAMADVRALYAQLRAAFDLLA